jgi:hypothetical protein
LDTVAHSNSAALFPYREFALGSDDSPSVAVRSIVRRVCTQLGWPTPINSPRQLPPIYLLALPEEGDEVRALLRQRAEEIPGCSLGITLEIYDWLLGYTAKHAGLPYSNILAQARRLYRTVERSFPWSQERVDRWQKAVDVLTYLRPRALVARESVMRVQGELVRANRLGVEVLDSYDLFAPMFDPRLDRVWPVERPREITGIEVERHGARVKGWVGSFSADDLIRQPKVIGDRTILAERSLFRRPEWDWPLEERVAGPVPAGVSVLDLRSINSVLPDGNVATRAAYEQAGGFRDVAVIRNDRIEPSTPASNWIALNPFLGRRLGWKLSDDGLFRWEDDAGHTMVESLWWRDGWVEVQPPRTFCTLGEGWLILCAPEAYAAIREQLQSYRIVIAGRRECRANEETSERISATWFAERPM